MNGQKVIPGITLSLSPSRLLRILGLLGELVNLSACSICCTVAGCWGILTSLAAEVAIVGAAPVILVPMGVAKVGGPVPGVLLRLSVWLLDKLMAIGCPTGLLVLAM